MAVEWRPAPLHPAAGHAWMETRPSARASLFAPGQPSLVRTDRSHLTAGRLALRHSPCCGSGQRMGFAAPVHPPRLRFHALPQPSSAQLRRRPLPAARPIGQPARSPLAAARPGPGGATVPPGWCRCGRCRGAGQPASAQGTPGLVGVSAGRTIRLQTALILHERIPAPEALRVLPECLRAQGPQTRPFSS